jgi:hypothetical protein
VDADLPEPRPALLRKIAESQEPVPGAPGIKIRKRTVGVTSVDVQSAPSVNGSVSCSPVREHGSTAASGSRVAVGAADTVSTVTIADAAHGTTIGIAGTIRTDAWTVSSAVRLNGSDSQEDSDRQRGQR